MILQQLEHVLLLFFYFYVDSGCFAIGRSDMPTYEDCGHAGRNSARGKCWKCSGQGFIAGGLNQPLWAKRKGGTANTLQQRQPRTAVRKAKHDRKRKHVNLIIRRRPLQFMLAAMSITPSPRPVFLDLFSGAGGVARAVEQYGGYAIQWDIKHGAQYDLQEEENIKLILTWIRNDCIWGLHLAMLCRSWTRARRAQNSVGGAKPLRSRSHTRGLAGLRKKELALVEEGNRLLDNSLRIAKQAIQCKVMGAFENPHGAYSFLDEETEKVIEHASVNSIWFDQCSFGTPYRKRTRLLFWHCNLQVLIAQRCKGRKGFCCFTSCRHTILGYQSSEAAAKYMKGFCNALAAQFATAYGNMHSKSC